MSPCAGVRTSRINQSQVTVQYVSSCPWKVVISCKLVDSVLLFWRLSAGSQTLRQRECEDADFTGAFNRKKHAVEKSLLAEKENNKREANTVSSK